MLKLHDIEGFPRTDLIQWVADNCVCLREQTPAYLEQVSTWCEDRFGESRAGNILQEALEGWIDYFDGDWQLIFNPFVATEQLVIWFANRNDLVEFSMLWG